jgi:predicted ATP-dependent serine protease
MEQRLKEAAKLGFASAVVPSTGAAQADAIRLMPLSQLHELVAWFGLPETE